VLEPECRTDVSPVGEPCAAAAYSALAISCHPWASVGRGTLIAFLEAILHPLEDIAGHIVEPKAVRLEGSDRRGLAVIPFTSAIYAIGGSFAYFVATEIPRGRFSPRRVFPFSFA